MAEVATQQPLAFVGAGPVRQAPAAPLAAPATAQKQGSSSSAQWGAACTGAAALVLVASRPAKRGARRPAPNVVRLAKTEGRDDAAAIAAALAVAAAAAAVAEPALAQETVAIAGNAATAAADSVAAVSAAAADSVAAASTAAADTVAAASTAAADSVAAPAGGIAESVTNALTAPIEAMKEGAERAQAEAQEVAAAPQEDQGDWFSPWVDFNAGIIAGIDDVIEEKLNLPNTFGLAIILYTGLIKLLTYPLSSSSLRSNAMMQLLQPKISNIQQKYKNDQETLQRMTMRLYDDCGVNPLGGCLPSLVQFPIFIGLYRAINKLAERNPHFKEPFLWIPSLSGPTTQGTPNLDWLLKSKFEDHFEPSVGWEDAGKYMILPVALVVSQFITMKTSAPPSNPNQGGPLAALTNIFPLIIGYTCMVSPAGLGIYWFMNNAFTGLQTTMTRNALMEEFPEYKKLMDGTAAKEAQEAADRKAARVAEATQRGFAASASAPAAKEAVEEEEEAEPVRSKPVRKAPKVKSDYDPVKQKQRRMKRRQRGKRMY